MSKQYGKGSKPRPFSVSYTEFSDRWENIFGKKKIKKNMKTEDSSSLAKKPSRRKPKFELCPHCSTVNLVKVNEFTSNCKKCKWSS